MKKFASILLALVLLALLPMQVLADEPDVPAAPTITSQTKQQDPFFGETATLTVSATCEEGAALSYQWYVADTEDESQLRAIDGATAASYSLTALLDSIGKTQYYRVSVYAVKDGEKSEPTNSAFIRVTVHSLGDSIEILQKPNKCNYVQGEKLDLTGLLVRIYTENGYFESKDGEGLKITTEPLTTVGTQRIAIFYGNMEPTYFDVTVTAPEKHEHSFPNGWVITSQATCKEEGIRVRECECGYTERESIPKTEHHWDQGQKKDGFTVYTCTVCGETRKEGSGSVTLPTASSEQPTQEPESEESTQPTQPTQPEQQGTTVEFRSPWKTVAILIAALLVCGIAAVSVLMLIRKRK